MATLFVLSHAPHADPNEARKVQFAREGDGVILIEDAVYGGGAAQTPLTAHIEEGKARGLRFYVLGPDAQARGIDSSLPVVDYSGFADLIVQYDRAVH